MTPGEKAAVLVEALPWLERLAGRVVVLKVGGRVLAEPALRDGLADDVVFLRRAGVRVVVVHGGGAQVSAHLERLGVPTVFAGGLRVTTPETMTVVRMVLVGQVNRDLVGAVNRHGPYAVGLSGEDARLLTAVRRTHPVDLGLVGDVVEVRAGALSALLDDGRVPVVASVATGTDGAVYNVNADAAAAAVAAELGADKLVLLTDVPGVLSRWPDGDVLAELTAGDLVRMLPSMEGGMVPKLTAALSAVRAGVPRVHVLDGRTAHAVLLEVFTDAGIGTMVVA